jgi:hypothetical protein
MSEQRATRATGNQLVEIHRRLTATVPSDLTYHEAAAFTATGGIFDAVEAEWLRQRTTIANTMQYRTYTKWIAFPMMFIIAPVLNGVTFSILWHWFVADVYGMAEVPIPVAVGIMLMAGLVIANLKRVEWKDTSYRSRFWRILLWPFLKTAMFLGVGWFFQLFI